MRWSTNRRGRRGLVRERRGFTLILIVTLMTVLLGATALVVDAGLLYLYRGQLQNAADASALAGAISLAKGGTTSSVDSAIAYDSRNRVGGLTTTLAAGDVVPGTWTRAGGFVSTAGDWTTGNPFAVKTTTRYTSNYSIFARYLGFTSKALTATAVAVHGSVGAADCVRPWAVPYQDMLDALPGGHSASTYDLTTADVALLAAMGPGNAIELNEPGSGEGAPHQMRAVELPAGEYADGTAGSPWGNSGKQYRDAISESCAALAADMGTHTSVGVNDWLQTVPGQKVGDTEKGVSALCGGSDTCAPPVRVNTAIWDTYGNGPGGHCSGCYHVKYMGIFYVTGYNKATNSVTGYFSALTAAAGGFVAKPGPISKNALVQ
jgi:Flp pilus assembly protein TadG